MEFSVSVDYDNQQHVSYKNESVTNASYFHKIFISIR